MKKIIMTTGLVLAMGASMLNAANESTQTTTVNADVLKNTHITFSGADGVGGTVNGDLNNSMNDITISQNMRTGQGIQSNIKVNLNVNHTDPVSLSASDGSISNGVETSNLTLRIKSANDVWEDLIVDGVSTGSSIVFHQGAMVDGEVSEMALTSQPLVSSGTYTGSYSTTARTE